MARIKKGIINLINFLFNMKGPDFPQFPWNLGYLSLRYMQKTGRLPADMKSPGTIRQSARSLQAGKY
jgi:hypothetical protein